MTALLPQPGIEIEIALGIGRADQAGVWDSGSWDYSRWQQPDTTLGNWVDVTCDTADGFTMGAGASSADGIVTRWEAATVALTLIGDQWDPRSGPYADVLGASIQARIRWRVAGDTTWITTFLGFVDENGFTYDPKTKRAQVACTDGTRILNGFDGLEQPPIGAGETAAQRVARIADYVGWPAGQRDITAGGVTVQATTLADNAWTMLLTVADTDLALLWVDRAGNLAYRPEGKVTPAPAVAAVITCGDVPAGTTKVRPVTIDGQQAHITRNIVAVSATGGIQVTMRDDASVALYWPHTYERTDLIHTDDTWSQKVAYALLLVGAYPTNCPDTARLDSLTDAGAAALLLGLEPDMTIAVEDLDGGRWLCEPAGWSVTVGRDGISGDIHLLDVSQWLGATWDIDSWDHGRWGF
jgi:hypothetical protein